MSPVHVRPGTGETLVTTLEEVRQRIEAAGADRIGTSAGLAIVQEWLAERGRSG